MADGKFSDAELLGGTDDDETNVGAEDALDLLDDNVDSTEQIAAGDDDAVDVEFEIVDDDTKAEQNDGKNGQDDVAARGVDGDDFDTGEGGEEVDLLSADEKKNWSGAMQKRVMRERRIRREAEGREVATATELANTKRQLIQSNLVAITLLADNLDGKIASKTVELKAAKEAADTDKELTLQGELDDLRAKRREAAGGKEALEAAAKEPAKPAAQAPLTQRWLARNKFMADPEFVAEKNYAYAIDNQLGTEFKAGKFAFGPDTPQYFAELDRRIHKSMPTLRARVQRTSGGQQPRPAQSRPAPQQRVAAVSRTGATVRTAANGVRNGKVQLTREDLENARTFGIDTNDKKQLAELARNKRDRILAEQGAQ